MEKDKPPSYRNILACYNRYTCVGWLTEEELAALREKESVNWYAVKVGETMTYHHLEEHGTETKKT